MDLSGIPFRFTRLSDGRVLISADTGAAKLLSAADFDRFISGRLPAHDPLSLDLQGAGFYNPVQDGVPLQVFASQWRTKKSFMEAGPRLHIFVPTLRCNQGCGYCQVSRADQGAVGVDMAEEDALAAIDLMLAAPSPQVTMEFQGGEPLLAFDRMAWMMEQAQRRADALGKCVNYVICTNLTLLEDRHLDLFQRFGMAVSTSLDGPAFIHDRNRPMTGNAAHARVTDNIRRCQDRLGPGSVSALMTATALSLDHGPDIIAEYLRLDLHSIFLRELNPYGYAAKSAKAIGYHTDRFVDFYIQTLDHILALNRDGTDMSEGYAAILLRKMLTPFGVGFVDLQSPTGEGFGVVLYNYDGRVFASDEARMLAEMGDDSFCLGHVGQDWNSLFRGSTMQVLAAAGLAESLPGCSDCAFVPFCGADPIRHYRTQNDVIGHRATSGFCRKHRRLFDHLFRLWEDADAHTRAILLGWNNPARTNLPVPPWR